MSKQIKVDSAYQALKFVFPDLNIKKEQITPEAAAFAFKVLVKVDKGARFSKGAFDLHKVYSSWTSFGIAFCKAISEILKNPNKTFKNPVAIALIAKQHERNLKMHLQNPETFPCPDFKN